MVDLADLLARVEASDDLNVVGADAQRSQRDVRCTRLEMRVVYDQAKAHSCCMCRSVGLPCDPLPLVVALSLESLLSLPLCSCKKYT